MDEHPKLIPVTGYLSRAQDAELVAWLKRQPNQSAIVRLALQRFFREAQGPASRQAPVDLLAVREAAAAGARDALADLSITTTSPGVQEDEDEIETLLNELGDNLVL